MPGLALDRVARFKATGKKHLLLELARLAAPAAGLDERALAEMLADRERQGSTGIGHGVGIPHVRVAGLPGLYGLFARLDKPVDFESHDGQPVDLVYLLLSPADRNPEHLTALAKASRLLSDESVRDKLRGAANDDALVAILTLDQAQAA